MSETIKIMNFLQILLVIWFILMSGFYFYYSYKLLSNTPADVSLQEPPIPPVVPEEINKKTIELYKQTVEAYSKSINAYNTSSNAVQKSNKHAAYELVIKETLMDLLTKFVVAFLGFAFVKATAIVINNFLRMKKGLDPESITIF